MKKKILSLLMVAAMSFGVVGCGVKSDKDSSTKVAGFTVPAEKEYYLAILPDNITKVTHRGYGLGVVTIDGYKDAGIKIDDRAISSTYLNEEGIAEGSFTVYVDGYTEEDAKMYNRKVDLESIQLSNGNDEGLVEIYEDGDYIIQITSTTMNVNEQGYTISCFKKCEDGDQLSALVVIRCKQYDKETIRKYLAKISYSLASENDEEYIAERIFKYTNSKGWITLTDATLLTDMRETKIKYDNLVIESYKDEEKAEDWKSYTENNGFTVYVENESSMNKFYFCKGSKCYFSVECKDSDLDMTASWEKIKASILQK